MFSRYLSAQIKDPLRFFRTAVVNFQQFRHGRGNLRGEGRGLPADFVGHLFLAAHGKPGLAAVTCAVFERTVQFFDERLSQGLRGILNDQILSRLGVRGKMKKMTILRLRKGGEDGQTASICYIGIIVRKKSDFP